MELVLLQQILLTDSFWFSVIFPELSSQDIQEPFFFFISGLSGNFFFNQPISKSTLQIE